MSDLTYEGFNQVETLPISYTQIGAILPERVLQDLLKLGFERINDDPSLIDELFVCLNDVTRNDIRSYFLNHNVTVRLNFPRDAVTFPLVALLAASDVEDQGLDLMGDYFTSGLDDVRTEKMDIIGHAVKTEIQVMCMAGKDANAALWLYYVAKAILMLNRDTLMTYGLHNLLMSGQDVSLREDFMPEFTYVRSLVLSFDTHFTVTTTERVAKALSIRLFSEDLESDTKVQLNVEHP